MNEPYFSFLNRTRIKVKPGRPFEPFGWFLLACQALQALEVALAEHFPLTGAESVEESDHGRCFHFGFPKKKG